VVIVGGKKVIQFSSNNYLGLADHPVLKRAAHDAIEQYGFGTGASRLIAGNLELYEHLEKKFGSVLKELNPPLFFPPVIRPMWARFPPSWGKKILFSVMP